MLNHVALAATRYSIRKYPIPAAGTFYLRSSEFKLSALAPCMLGAADDVAPSPMRCGVRGRWHKFFARCTERVLRFGPS
ncbi:hypothetical protein EVAR_14345_1 [Eumeta japonica]|uniref:Uncharacterized protein n=1 Tax=Eumeta variegata TaxID=151549 RepID=A0A4C1TY99_EUMVA|nr:hypothetical protein EVAR_14345_1 [Eumeta japonica]